ncbi:hypothetical protein F5884DRAFT_11342 [Xylogone sp. PMI_703]|nr:hypothetical protein F5884DRAFT_11342 [Xylogone sp. PMI_703]
MGRGYSISKCHTCRQRKLKCDGTKPACMRCTQSRVPCHGYELVARFRLKTPSQYSGSDEKQVLPPNQFTTQHASLNPLMKLQTMAVQRSGYTVSPSISTVHQYTSAFIDAFASEYVLNARPYATFHELGTNATHIEQNKLLLAQTCELAIFDKTHILQNALVALSLTLGGIQCQRRDLNVQAIEFYLATLREMKRQANILLHQQSTSDENWQGFLSANLIAALYEIAANSSIKGFENHMQGAALMLERRGVENFNDAMSQHVLYDFRGFEYMRCLSHRQASFLCEQSWKEPPWLDQYPYGHGPVQTLISFGLDLLPLLEQFDGIIKHNDNSKNDPSTLKILLKSSQDVYLKLQRWREDCSGVDGPLNTLPQEEEHVRAQNSALVAEVYYMATMMALLDLQVQVLKRLDSTIDKIQNLKEKAEAYADWTQSYCERLQRKPCVFTQIVCGYALNIATRYWRENYNVSRISL